MALPAITYYEDDKGGTIRQVSEGCFELHCSERHMCGLSGFSGGCPACRQGNDLHMSLRELQRGEPAERSEDTR
jgi:hypothetical protein